MEMPKLQKITPHKEMVVQRITVATTLACVPRLCHSMGIYGKMSFNQYCCLTTSCKPLDQCLLTCWGEGRLDALCLFGLILPASLGLVVSVWESAWE